MQQFELTHEFLSQLEELIDAGNKTEVSKQIAGLPPADIAEIDVYKRQAFSCIVVLPVVEATSLEMI